MNLALLSYWHVHARDYEREAIAHAATEIAVVWDEDGDRGVAEAARIGARFEPDLENVLADPTIDGVIVTAATSEHPRILQAAARAGKHIFTEKVIAASTDDADSVLNAVHASGVVMGVCLPRLSNGYTQAIETLIADGALGRVTYFRMRVGHNGALRTEEDPNGWLPPHFFNADEALGGALIDLGAHPLYLALHFMGEPGTVSATYGFITGRAVEDHAVVTLGYADGGIAVAEVSFIDQPSTWELEVHGDRGMVRIAAPDMELAIRRAQANRRDRANYEPVPVPADRPTPFEQWVDRATRGEGDASHLRLARNLTRLAEAASDSARMGKVICLDRHEAG